MEPRWHGSVVEGRPSNQVVKGGKGGDRNKGELNFRLLASKIGLSHINIVNIVVQIPIIWPGHGFEMLFY